MKNGNHLHTLPQLAKHFGFSYSFMLKSAKACRFPVVKIGSNHKARLKDVENWVCTLTTGNSKINMAPSDPHIPTENTLNQDLLDQARKVKDLARQIFWEAEGALAKIEAKQGMKHP